MLEHLPFKENEFDRALLLCSRIQFLTSGGGSMAWRGDIKWWNPEELKLYYDGQGFMSVEMTKKVANFSYHDVFGNVLHKWSLSKELDSSA